MMNYADMNEIQKKNYDEFSDEVYKFRGASVWDSNEPYVELKKCAYKHKDAIKSIIEKYGYEIVEENETNGSDYTAYYIWFKEEQK